MDLKLNPYQNAITAAVAAAGIASSGGLGTATTSDNLGANFSGSLSQALDAVASSVQAVRTQLSSGPALADKASLQNTFSDLGTLLGQFTEMMQSAAQRTGNGADPAVQAASGTAGPGSLAQGVAAPSLAATADALQRAASEVGSAGATTLGTAVETPAKTTASVTLGASDTAAKPAAASSPEQVYLTRLQANNPTDKWVAAALNKSIAQAEANGYDPEKSHAVNTLRGYFSGDAQARSNAIHSLSSAMLEAGGAYETFDYGVHTIAGKAPPDSMNTTMPSFKTAFDKDWNRPSLYDMINSSLGWPGDVPGASGKPVNFADPSLRDDALNRKLSDAEITAFQTGQLTPELQALVHQYRSATA